MGLALPESILSEPWGQGRAPTACRLLTGRLLPGFLISSLIHRSSVLESSREGLLEPSVKIQGGGTRAQQGGLALSCCGHILIACCRGRGGAAGGCEKAGKELMARRRLLQS